MALSARSPRIRGTLGVQELDLSFRLRADVALELVDVERGSPILDVGAGLGAFAGLLAEHGHDVTCVDVSGANVAALHRRLPGIHAVQGDATRLPFADGTFAAVVCMEVLEHVEDDRQALREIRRVLADGGLVLLSVPNASAPAPLLERTRLGSVHAQEGPERHYRDGYSAETLERLLSESGFSVDAVRSVGGAPYRLAVGMVSLAHLLVRRAHGQRTWTWADVDADEGSAAMRAYRLVFPLFLGVARLGAVRNAPTGATLVLRARRVEAT